MNARTVMSAKGQVVIPSDVRKSLELSPGQTFDVLSAGGDVILRPSGRRTTLSVADALANLRAKVGYRGPRLSIEQLSWSPSSSNEDRERE